MKINILLALLLFNLNSFSQKISFKNDKILVDNIEVFVYKKTNRGEFSIYDKTTKKELVFIYYNDNGTRGYYDDDYIKITFLELNKSMENDLALWSEKLIKWFLENNLFNKEGKWNEEAINQFITKYNQNISNRTIIH